MKILYLTNYPSPYRVNFFNLFGKCVQLTVTFEETSIEQKHRRKEWFNNNIENFEAIFLKKRKIFKLGKKIIYDFPQINKIISNNYDFVIIGGYTNISSIKAIKYMRKHKIKYFINADGAIHKNGKGIKERFKQYLLKGADGYFSPSKLTDEYFEFYGANPKRIFRYNFTSLTEEDLLKNSIIDKEKIRNKIQLDLNKKIIVTAGQFIHRKGFDILIESAKYMDDNIEIIIIGGKPTKEYIELAEKEEVLHKIHFIDFKVKEELYDYFKAADLFVLPTREDIWGLVINEAMSCGLPVITTNKCGAGLELIENGENGFIINPNKRELAEAVNKIFKLNLEEIAKKNIKKIKQFSLEKMAQKHYEILENWVEENENE